MQLLGVLGWSRVAGWGGLPRAGGSFTSVGQVAGVLSEGVADALPGGRDLSGPSPGGVDT